MEQNSDLINKYIEKLNNELSEAGKKRIILELQLEIANENLALKEQELQDLRLSIEKDITEVKAELRSEFEKEKQVLQEFFGKKNQKNVDEYSQEITTILDQKRELQEECNSLREAMKLQAEKFEALNTPKKRLRTSK